MAGTPDNEYMEMDADQWEGNIDDIYENGDTLNIIMDDRGGQNKDSTNRNPNFARPLPKRYITIRRSPMSQNKGDWKRKLFDIFKFTTVGLVVLCILLIASLIALSFAYDRLANIHMTVNVRMDSLIQKNNMLEAWFKEITQNQSWSKYHISSTVCPDCLSGDDVYVVDRQALKKYIMMDSFYLYYSNETCSNQYAWNCTC